MLCDSLMEVISHSVAVFRLEVSRDCPRPSVLEPVKCKNQTLVLITHLSKLFICVCLCYLIGEIQLVGMFNQSGPEAEAQLTLQESDGAVYESCRNCNEEPLGELKHEGLRILLNNTPHYHT